MHTHTHTRTDFIVTGSQDGHVKFWKKQVDGVEFVKHFRAHLGERREMCKITVVPDCTCISACVQKHGRAMVEERDRTVLMSRQKAY